MRLTECEKSTITDGRNGYRKTKIYGLLCDFRDSDMQCARVDDHQYVSAKTGYNSIKASINHFRMPGISVMTRRGQLYIIKTEV